MPGYRSSLLSRLCGLGGVCAWLVFGPGIWAQGLGSLRHQAWSTEDGLPQNSVHQVVQGGDGFIWAATEAGVARFDGVGFRTFDHRSDPAFVSDDACCVVRDGVGDLWVGTVAGVLRLHDGRFTRFDVRDGLPSAQIQRIVVTGGGRVVVVTTDGASVWREGHFERIGGDGGAEVGGWSFSKTAVVGAGRRWSVGGELPGSRVETLFVDREGRAWVGTNDGLVVLTKDSEAVTSVAALRGSVVLSVYEDREGNIWVGSETTGLHVLRTAKFRTEEGLSGKALTTVVEAGDGVVWAGTREDGLRRWRGGVVDEPVREGGLTSPVILSLAPGVGGGVWAGTPDGLNAVDARGGVRRFTSADGLPDDYIQALAAGADGGVWAGTRHGLVHLRGGKMEVLTKADGLGGDLIGTLLMGANGELWVGTSGGLSRRGIDGRIVTYAAGSGPAGIVTAMAQDRGGRIWVATKDGGLGRFGDGGYGGVKSGVGVVSGMVADGMGFLWLRMERGVERVAIADLDRCVASGEACVGVGRRYGTADGMPSDEMVAGGSPVMWRMANGELWLTTRRGVAVVDPEHLPLNTVAPMVAIEGFLVDEAAVGVDAQPVEIGFGRTRYTMEFAGLSFAVPSQVRYRCWLEGFDKGWVELGGRRTATYTNLAPGGYVFRVEAMNNDGVWSERGAVLRFRVIPPFWRRWWFLALVVVGLVGVGVGLYRLRLRGLQRRFDAVLEERNRMAREIHDTLAQDFVGVTIQLDLIAQMLGGNKVEAAERQVKEARRLVTDGLAEARQSIWELRANLAVDSLPTRLAKVVERYEGGTLEVRLKIGGAFRQLDARVEGEVLRVAQEALSNVRRHAGAGRASIELRYGRDMLVLTIEDDGVGFSVDDASAAQGHYGLSGMRERAGLLGGRLEIVSSPGAGTKLTLATPIAGVKE